jgi:hypothetical protein
MNVFSSDEMLGSYAAAFLPAGSSAAVEVFSVEGWEFRLLRIPGRRPLVRMPFADYWEPVGRIRVGADAVRSGVRYLPRASIEAVSALDGVPDLRGKDPSPSVRWGDVDGWTAFESLVAKRSRGLAADSRRQLRRLGRELGEVEFSMSGHDDAAFDACLRWKSDRYRQMATHLRDERMRAFMLRLSDEGILHVSALRAEGRILAAHIGLLHSGRFYYWIPAYDPEYRRYSPGRLLLEQLLAASHEREDEEFDFLVGNEAYKWIYATSARLVAPLGRAPRGSVAIARTRRKLKLGVKARKARALLRL